MHVVISRDESTTEVKQDFFKTRCIFKLISPSSRGIFAVLICRRVARFLMGYNGFVFEQNYL